MVAPAAVLDVNLLLRLFRPAEYHTVACRRSGQGRHWPSTSMDDEMEQFEADDACMFEGGADSADTDPSCGICLECAARRQPRAENSYTLP